MIRNNSDILAVLVLSAGTLSADYTSSTIDLVGAGSNMLVLNTGVGGITFDPVNRIDIKITHSDDDTTYTPIAQTDVIIDGDDTIAIVDPTTGNVMAFISAHAAATVDRFEYIGGKRYVKIFLDFGGTHGTGTPFSITLVQSRLHLTGKS